MKFKYQISLLVFASLQILSMPVSAADNPSKNFTAAEIRARRLILQRAIFQVSDLSHTGASYSATAETGILWGDYYVANAVPAAFTLNTTSKKSFAMRLSSETWDEKEQVYNARGTVIIDSSSANCSKEWPAPAKFKIRVVPKDILTFAGAWFSIEVETEFPEIDQNCNPIPGTSETLRASINRQFTPADLEAVMRVAKQEFSSAKMSMYRDLNLVLSDFGRVLVLLEDLLERQSRVPFRKKADFKRSLSHWSSNLLELAEKATEREDHFMAVENALNDLLRVLSLGYGECHDIKFDNFDRFGRIPNDMLPIANGIWFSVMQKEAWKKEHQDWIKMLNKFEEDMRMMLISIEP